MLSEPHFKACSGMSEQILSDLYRTQTTLHKIGKLCTDTNSEAYKQYRYALADLESLTARIEALHTEIYDLRPKVA